MKTEVTPLISEDIIREEQCKPHEGEEFRLVKGLERTYISNFGRVMTRSKKNYLPRIRGLMLRKGSPYLQIKINEGGCHRICYVHTCVCEAFHGPRPGGLSKGGKNPAFTVSHLDNNPTNNRADNLKWDTVLTNLLNAPNHIVSINRRRKIQGLKLIGRAEKFSNPQKILIFQQYSDSDFKVTQMQLAINWSCSKETVRKAITQGQEMNSYCSKQADNVKQMRKLNGTD